MITSVSTGIQYQRTPRSKKGRNYFGIGGFTLIGCRLDMHHEIMLMMLDGELYLAPVKDPQRILDIGTGTGIWAIDAADKHGGAEVIGVDLR